MRRLLLVLLALAFAGCTTPSEGGVSPFAQADEDYGDDELVGDDDDATDDSTGDDDDSVPLGDDDDATDDPDDKGWDPSEPESLDGSLVHFDLDCGLLMGAARKTWERADDRWVELRIEGQESRPRPELEVCFSDGNKFLEWADDGEIYIEAGGLGHDLSPTLVEDRWMGSVYPLTESSPQCDEALALAGLSWPVTMSLELVAFER
ncbi:MAG: hypothetical protein KDA24_22830 [Deltaproteobacteria bacterium]|nr:hypothetical protein [Deltaproteobacteria bacterium]